MTNIWRSLGALAVVACFTTSQGMVASPPLPYRLASKASKASMATTTTSVTSGTSSVSASSTGTPNSGGSNSTTSGTVPKQIASAWYPSWLASTLPLQNVSWSKYNMMIFSFATTTSDPAVLGLDTDSQTLLPQFVQMAKANNVTALLSIGGWSGSAFFSTAAGSPANRTAFIGAIVNSVNKYGLDGIEFDWEFPGEQTTECNVVSSNDTANFLTLLQELRQDPVGAKLVLTAAVDLQPWVGVDGATPLSDVKEYASVLDLIEIMAYDVWGSWSATTGPNAPLDDSCAPAHAGSAKAAVSAWSAANFPVNQIVLGLPAYGRGYFVNASDAFTSTSQTALSPYDPFQQGQEPVGESVTEATVSDPTCDVTTDTTGEFTFSGLIDAGFLTKNGTASPGIMYTFDQCSQTPFVYNKTSSVFISYDDASSFAAKGKYIAGNGLRGFAIWQGAGDSGDMLLNAVNTAMGL